MSDDTFSLLCFGLALIGLLYILRWSNRARAAAAAADNRTALQRAEAAADFVINAGGMSAWVRCTVCRHRHIVDGLDPAELTTLIAPDSQPVCPSCTATLEAAEAELTA